MSAASLEFNLADSSRTEALGAALGTAFLGNDEGAVVYLQGELGAGKTTCVRSLLRALGVTGTVRSPTYTLLDTYSLIELSCVHVDLYRVQSATEVEELGLRDLTGRDCLMLIEWPQNGGSAVPPADLTVYLKYAHEARVATLSSNSSVGARWLAKLGLDTSLMPYVSNLT
jgi:tRNA threonylcarbamoyladenosine biosynthesis protein TsaE